MTRSLDEVPGGLLSLADDLRILATNRGLAEMVGRPVEALLGTPFEALLTSPSAILFQTNVYPALRSDGRVAEVFLTLRATDGGTIPVLLNGVRVDGPGPPTYELLIVRILARARWEAELLASARALEGAKSASERLARDLVLAAEEKRRTDEFRDAFIGVVSHELRTPITTIYGMSQLLRGRHAEMDAVTLSRHLEDVAAESDRLRRLTEDLLILSRTEAGRLELAADPMMLGRLAGRVAETVARDTPDRRITTHATEPLPVVLGDEPLVEQVIRNLLSNAVKYSPPGSRIAVTVTAEDAGAAVRIVDEGPGIGDGPAERLFEVFYRTEDAKRRTPGAGIGLFVCRSLVLGMGGRIWAAEAPAPALRGAEFGFWLPAASDD